MKNLSIVLILLSCIVFNQMVQAQVMADTIAGMYTFKTNDKHYDTHHESLVLKKNHRFVYKCFVWRFREELIEMRAEGVWMLANNHLVLNSLPQIERIAIAKKKKQRKRSPNGYKYNFRVVDKRMQPVVYTLQVTDAQGKAFTYKKQSGKSNIVLEAAIKSYQVIQTPRLQSPKYVVPSNAPPKFYVLYEPLRVFMNEKWQLSPQGIQPITFDGALGKHRLIKQTQ